MGDEIAIEGVLNIEVPDTISLVLVPNSSVHSNCSSIDSDDFVSETPRDDHGVNATLGLEPLPKWSVVFGALSHSVESQCLQCPRYYGANSVVGVSC